MVLFLRSVTVSLVSISVVTSSVLVLLSGVVLISSVLVGVFLVSVVLLHMVLWLNVAVVEESEGLGLHVLVVVRGVIDVLVARGGLVTFLVLLVLSGVFVEGIVISGLSVVVVTLISGFMSGVLSLLVEVLGVSRLVTVSILPGGILMAEM